MSNAAERSFHLVVNPGSGGGTGPAAVVAVARLLRQAGAAVEVTFSPGPLQCREVVTHACARGDVVVAVGGDGMVSSLAGALVEVGGTFGLVPCGRGNDFARALGLSRQPEALVRTLLEAEPRDVDVIDADGRVVVGSVYAGVDAVASQIVDAAHRMPASVQYPYAAVRALASYRPATYTLDVDGARHEHCAATVVVANSGFYGKGMNIAPGASVQDGLLDVVVVQAASRLRLLRSLPRVYDGSHLDLDEVQVWRGERVVVRADRPLTAYGDGEPVAALPLTASVRPAALRVLA